MTHKIPTCCSSSSNLIWQLKTKRKKAIYLKVLGRIFHSVNIYFPIDSSIKEYLTKKFKAVKGSIDLLVHYKTNTKINTCMTVVWSWNTFHMFHLLNHSMGIGITFNHIPMLQISSESQYYLNIWLSINCSTKLYTYTFTTSKYVQSHRSMNPGMRFIKHHVPCVIFLRLCIIRGVQWFWLLLFEDI